MTQLALFGGPRSIDREFPRYNPIGREEMAAAQRVLQSGVLSKFLGAWDADFYGGPEVQGFEREWERAFRTKHAVTVNSATSGLIAALGAVGVEPGDEVIVSPWTMSASATAILVWNAIPVFADIQSDTFNLDPIAVEKAITPRTRAIMAVDIFGQAADLDALMAIARRHGLAVIEDCAQAPGALHGARYTGTVADIGVYSLNYHKHIHTGEGGVCVTDDARLAERMQLIRNHAESVVGDKGVTEIDNMIGFNFRMTEIEAAIGREQLKKLPALVASRQALAARLSQGLAGLKGLQTPVVRSGNTHAYYVYPMTVDAAATGVGRDRLIEALAAEGLAVGGGYVNLHLLPMYQRRIAYGKGGYPWKGGPYRGAVDYSKGICPVAESLHQSRLMHIGMCQFDYRGEDMELLAAAFRKVWASLDAL
ncbi:MAG TPA: DegT/DnrJ/EryC1/StrS family aminotransferase [Burkholderiales bacterium]|nr:DegT/DnrJ/EryC1/StrS family aminotransferase [Burkholderiales bacterium]